MFHRISVIVDVLIVARVGESKVRDRCRERSIGKGEPNVGLSSLPAVDNVVAGKADCMLVVSRSYAPSSVRRAVSHVPYSNMVAWPNTGSRARVWLFQSVVVRCSIYCLGTGAVCRVAPSVEVCRDTPCGRVSGPDQGYRVKPIICPQGD